MNRRTQVRQLSFSRVTVTHPLDELRLSRPLPPGATRTERFRRLLRSMERLGQVVPLVVLPPVGVPLPSSDVLIVDGELRFTALQRLGICTACCIQPIPRSSTPRSERLNMPSVAQEFQIVRRAVDAGVCTADLARMFGVPTFAIELRLGMLSGICPDALLLLGDTPASEGAYTALRRLRPKRQVEAAQAMLDLDDFSARIALALVRSTPGDQFIRKPKFIWTDEEKAAASQLREEFAATAAETRRLLAHHAQATLELAVLAAHVRALLTNPVLVRWLARHRPELLQRLVAQSDPIDLAEVKGSVAESASQNPGH